jgi:hypothetical protein
MNRIVNSPLPRQRGLVRGGYRGHTRRAALGLPVPADRHSRGRAQGAVA